MPASPRRSPMNARDRENRRIRMPALVKGGLCYDLFARLVNLARERIGRINVESLQGDRSALKIDGRSPEAASAKPKTGFAGPATP